MSTCSAHKNKHTALLQQAGVGFLILAVTLFDAGISSATAEEPPSWIIDSNAGCKLWNGAPQPNETVTWTGECRNGYAEGVGVEEWYQDQKLTERVEGLLIEGKLNGKGTSTWATGETYVGSWRDSQYHGKGIHILPNGERYEGQWAGGKRNGTGINILPNGERYEGQWEDGKRQGKGKYSWPDGRRYAGEWKDNQLTGQGTLKWPNGETYVGTWQNGLRDGYGTLANTIGDKVVGEWRADRLIGIATLTRVDGEKYVGEWQENKFNGRGTHNMATQDQYVGDFKNGARDGFGTYTFASGEKYVGEFKAGRREGQGVSYAASGEVISSGIWQNNKLIREVYFISPRRENNSPSSSSASPSQVAVPMKHSASGTYRVPILINGTITLDFLVDSGASDVSIPADVVGTLKRTGTLQPDDFLDSQTYVLADGSRSIAERFRIRSLTVGNIVLENVVGSIADAKGGLLLGQSFLGRFDSWAIDNKTHALVLSGSGTNQGRGPQ